MGGRAGLAPAGSRPRIGCALLAAFQTAANGSSRLELQPAAGTQQQTVYIVWRAAGLSAVWHDICYSSLCLPILTDLAILYNLL